MTGILSIRIAKNEKRQKCVEVETIGGVLFCVARLRLKSLDGVLDKLSLRSAMKKMSKDGIYRVAVLDDPYIKVLLERYNMTEVSHLPLLRSLSGLLLMKAAENLKEDIAVSVYARKIDVDVMRCVRVACDRFKNVQLDLGPMTETVRRQMMEENGASPIIGELTGEENPRVRVLFDRPSSAGHFEVGRTTTINLSGRSIEQTDYYDDIEAELLGAEVPEGTDKTGVLAEIVKNSADGLSNVRILSLVKKA